MAFIAANLAESKKALSTLILDIRTVSILADYFVITGGQTSTQVRAIADGIDEGLSELGFTPKSIEGKREGRWVLMDYEDIIVHILQEKERSYYKLEQFWNHALIVDRNEWYREE
jgi:ribosome-associated protein